MPFTQVEARRTDQVADVFNKQDAVIRQRQARGGVGNHLGIQVAAFAGVDLNRRGTGFANARRVVNGLLVAFDHRAGDAPVQALERFREQRGFAGAGAGDQVQHQLFAGGKAGAVAGGNLVIFVQHVDFHLQHLALADTRRVGTRFAVAVVEIARIGPLRGESDPGQCRRRAWGW